MAYSVNPESVKALQSYSAKITEAVAEIKNATTQMAGIVSENSQRIGPHADKIKAALESIKGAVLESVEPADEISEKLNDIADGYQEVIDATYYSRSGNRPMPLLSEALLRLALQRRQAPIIPLFPWILQQVQLIPK